MREPSTVAGFIRRKPALIALILGVAFTAVLAVSLRAALRDPPQSKREASDVRRFEDYPLLWLGESFEGLPLTSITRTDSGKDDASQPGQNGGFLFVYGTCDVGEADGCPPPLAVRSTTRCAGLAAVETVSGASSETGPYRAPRLIWTANVIVTFSGDPTLVANAAENLELANPSARGAEAFSGEGLPPPSREPC